jgi:hypothetical protein
MSENASTETNVEFTTDDIANIIDLIKLVSPMLSDESLQVIRQIEPKLVAVLNGNTSN